MPYLIFELDKQNGKKNYAENEIELIQENLIL